MWSWLGFCKEPPLHMFRPAFISPFVASLFAFALPAGATDTRAPRLSPEKIASLQARFGGVKRWELSYHYAGNNPHRWHDHGTDHARTQWHESSHGSFLVDTESLGAREILIRGKGPSFDTISIAYQTADPMYRTTRYDRGAGPATVAVEFLLDLTTGTYNAGFSHDSFSATYGGSETNAFETRTYGPSSEETHVNSPHPAPAYVRLKLPDEGNLITGSWSWEEVLEAKRRLGETIEPEYPEKNPTRGRITWTLRPADPIEVDLILEAVGDEHWLPEARQDELTPANDLQLVATLVPKNGGALTQRAVEFIFSLAEVSREPGVALNFPLGNVSGSPDLQFVAARNGDNAEIGPEGLSLVVRGPARERETAKLSSFDWGAYGSVEVRARLENGRVVRGRLRDGVQSQLQVPRRTQGGFIADAWRSRFNFAAADGDDSDPQPGNGKPGDGLTAYEEYRGMIIAGRHTRASGEFEVTRKDLVVLNEIGAAAKAGLALFEGASGIHIVEMRAAELPKSRQVNVHRRTASGGEQYAILLIDESLGTEAAGVNRPAEVLNKTPHRSEAAVVDVAHAREYYDTQAAIMKAAGMTMPYTAAEELAQTIAHEIAHGVGAPHHGKTTEFFGHRRVTVKMKDWHVYGIDGKRLIPTEEKPIELQGRIGRPGNDASGDIACIMAYPNFYQWAAVGPTEGPHRFYALAPQPLGKTFCQTSAGTGFNRRHQLPNGTSMPAFFGNAQGQGEGSPIGNCLGAMKVSDW
jgi:hypothetical protein